MPLFRRTPPPRRPHPDARTESQLQRIIALQERITRYTRLISDYRTEISEYHEAIRDLGVSIPNFGDATQRKMQETARQHVERISALQDEIRHLEESIDRAHVMVGARLAELNETDLAYLYP